MSDIEFTETRVSIEEIREFGIKGAPQEVVGKRPFIPDCLEIKVTDYVHPDQKPIVLAFLSGPIVLKGGAVGSRRLTMWRKSDLPQWANDFVNRKLQELAVDKEYL